MEFETNMEQMADQQDAFLEGWEPADQQEAETAEVETVETEEVAEEVVEEQAEETTEAEAETTETEETTATETEETADESATEESWIVNYMGKQETLTKADITPSFCKRVVIMIAFAPSTMRQNL